MDDYYSYNIEINGIRIATDTGLAPHSMPEANMLLTSPRYEREEFAEILKHIRPDVVIPYHWDNMYRSLSKPLKAMLRPPSMSIPPTRRMKLGDFKRTVASIDPSVKVFIPDVLRSYKIEDMLQLCH
jgi:L-ascorbate metabolism protein UlaG (beta-lactamase superfamily)